MKERIFNYFLIILVIICIFISYNITLVTNNQNENKIPENILFLGDSITAQYELDKYYSNTVYMVNSGFSGYSSEQLRKELQEKAYRYNPSKVFLLIGTNDIELKRDEQEIMGYIKDIIEGFKKYRKDSQIFIESIYPINNSNNDKIKHEVVGIRTNEKIKKVNNLIENYCKENDIYYINIYDKLLDEEGNLKIDYTKDGLHLSEKGYKKITRILKKYI